MTEAMFFPPVPDAHWTPAVPGLPGTAAIALSADPELAPTASDAAAERATLRSSYGLPPEPAAATGAEALERAELRRLYGLPDAPAK